MGARLTIDVNHQLVVSTYSGEINAAEILGQASLIRSHPDFDPSFSELVDLSGATVGSSPTSALQDLSRSVSIFSPTSLHVVIAPQDLTFGLVRMFEVFAEKTKPNIVLVRTIDEARKILRLEKTALD